jgi:hypothetical protein
VLLQNSVPQRESPEIIEICQKTIFVIKFAINKRLLYPNFYFISTTTEHEYLKLLQAQFVCLPGRN